METGSCLFHMWAKRFIAGFCPAVEQNTRARQKWLQAFKTIGTFNFCIIREEFLHQWFKSDYYSLFYLNTWLETGSISLLLSVEITI